MGVIGYVPIEEYMFFVIMSLLTGSFFLFVAKSSLPGQHLLCNQPSIKIRLVRWAPVLAALLTAVKGWTIAIPDTRTFYLGCILWWTMPVLAFLWSLSGPYMVSRWRSTLSSILIPTAYLCYVDTIALKAGTWHITERTSTGYMLFSKDLPIEEAMFFFLVNCLLVFGCSAFDLGYAIADAENVRQRIKPTVSLSYAKRLLKALVDPPINQQPSPADVAHVISVLKEASTSFYTASFVFPPEVRQDLCILYGFCRVTDDLVDDLSAPTNQKRLWLSIVQEFVQDLQYGNEKDGMVDWTLYQKKLEAFPDPESAMASFRSLAAISHRCVTQKKGMSPLDELLRGYKWDLDQKEVKTVDDLLEYSSYVASSVAEMCTNIFFWWYGNGKAPDEVLLRAREMGQALQLVNISRDFVTDAKKLERCYIPSEWCGENFVGPLRGPLSDKMRAELASYACKILDMADELSTSAQEGIAGLPVECRGGVRAATEVYSGIGVRVREIANDPEIRYVTRARVNKWTRLRIVFRSVFSERY